MRTRNRIPFPVSHALCRPCRGSPIVAPCVSLRAFPPLPRWATIFRPFGTFGYTAQLGIRRRLRSARLRGARLRSARLQAGICPAAGCQPKGWRYGESPRHIHGPAIASGKAHFASACDSSYYRQANFFEQGSKETPCPFPFAGGTNWTAGAASLPPYFIPNRKICGRGFAPRAGRSWVRRPPSAMCAART